MNSIIYKAKQSISFFIAIACTQNITAQALTETTGIRFYEHHSSDMTNMPFGNSANGAKSGYDFVNKTYFNSFDENTFGAYTNGEEANIDMVEHNGPFGTNGASMYLGFTAGVSTIWGGPIKGNGITKWMKAPAGFNYSSSTTANDLSSAYNPALASLAVAEVKNGDVYIGKIRNSELFVAIKCSNVHILSAPPTGQDDNVYFEFDYKRGGTFTGIAELENSMGTVSPNPAADMIEVQMNNTSPVRSIRVYSLLGQEVLSVFQPEASAKINVGSLPRGIYLLSIAAQNGTISTKRIILK